ncbi:methyltransferase domain-containing protein [Sphingorhabdus sp. Alg231-15]|uniref:methyltransferase domain-containing protein n=1 Tax=Sphingorhabdus sp. Alg231-15 TaxID=1922222 RepID=UPI000D557267
MHDTSGPEELFDRARRRHFRDRAFSRSQGRDFISEIMAKEILDRLSLVKREFKKCLLIGQAGPNLRLALTKLNINIVTADASLMFADSLGGVQCDEDRLPFADHSFDLIINIATLDSVNDLPGALALARRVLSPDGLFLASLIGAESLTTLKMVMMEAEGDRISAHVHPQIDIRTAGDLMARVGFALPVVDSDRLYLRYANIDKLVSDIRDLGSANILKDKVRSLPHNVYLKMKQGFQDRADSEGKTTEQIELVYLCGWAPHPDQPTPARRGSGQMSLKTVLNKPSED